MTRTLNERLVQQRENLPVHERLVHPRVPAREELRDVPNEDRPRFLVRGENVVDGFVHHRVRRRSRRHFDRGRRHRGPRVASAT